MISIIVPVYNKALVIGDCIESILAQTYRDIEIILINDGSTDGSGEIIDLLAEKDARIVTIHTHNGGPASARNIGLDIAKGELIGFVDADDTIEPEMFQLLHEVIISRSAEIAGCRYKDLRNGKLMDMSDGTGEVFVYTAHKYMQALIQWNDPLVSWNIWSKLFMKSSIGDLRFDESLRYNEDMVFCLDYFRKDIEIALVDKVLYNYNQNIESVSRDYNLVFIYDNLQSLSLLEQFIEDKFSKNEAANLKNNVIVKYKWLLLIYMSSIGDIKQSRQTLESLIHYLQNAVSRGNSLGFFWNILLWGSTHFPECCHIFCKLSVRLYKKLRKKGI